MNRHWYFGSLFAAGVLLITGCAEEERISSYSVPKEHLVFAANHVEGSGDVDDPQPFEAVEARMLGVIVPNGQQTWFFKITGPVEAVDAQKEDVLAFAKSLRFTDDGKPQWTTPEGWSERRGGGIRFATFSISSDDEPLELTVISLPSGEGDPDDYVLSNINRWRGQLGLDDLENKADLLAAIERGEEVKRIELEGGLSATWVDLVGKTQPSGMGRGPFQTGQDRATPSRPTPSPAASGLTYTSPDGWAKGRTSALRKAAFTVADGEQAVEITAIPLAAAAGDLLPNVNRWRDQVGLGEIKQAELDPQVQKLVVDGENGAYVELIGPQDANPRETILGVVVLHGSQAWFFKLKGDAGLASREKKRFEQFVRSVKFTRAQGVGNGE